MYIPDHTLNVAVKHGSLAMVSTLLDAGANPDALNMYWESALNVATVYAKSAFKVKLLIAAKANVNPIIDCLAFACANDLGEIANLLIEAGAAVRRRNHGTGDTALHCAVRACNYEAIGALLRHGADVCVKNLQGSTAKDVAKIQGFIPKMIFNAALNTHNAYIKDLIALLRYKFKDPSEIIIQYLVPRQTGADLIKTPSTRSYSGILLPYFIPRNWLRKEIRATVKFKYATMSLLIWFIAFLFLSDYNPLAIISIFLILQLICNRIFD